jgi:hypothetical protein
MKRSTWAPHQSAAASTRSTVTSVVRTVIGSLEVGLEVEVMRIPAMLSALVALTVVSAGAGEQLRIAASPAWSFAPADLSIRARVVPSAENRTLEIVAESGDFYRSSQIPLEGERAPATTMVEFRSLPSGDYVVYGILTDSSGRRRAIAEQSVKVLGVPH